MSAKPGLPMLPPARLFLRFRIRTIEKKAFAADAAGDTGGRVAEEFRDPVPVIVMEAFGATTLGAHGTRFSQHERNAKPDALIGVRRQSSICGGRFVGFGKPLSAILPSLC